MAARTTNLFVKVAKLGAQVQEVYLPDSGTSTVATALEVAGVDASGCELRVNNEKVELVTPLQNGDVVTLVPQIRGG